MEMNKRNPYIKKPHIQIYVEHTVIDFVAARGLKWNINHQIYL